MDKINNISKSPLRVVFMGSPSFAAQIFDYLSIKYSSPVLVISQNAKPQGRGQLTIPTDVAQWAQSHSLPLLTTDRVNDDEALQKIASVKPDILLVIAFGQLLKTPLLQLPSKYPLNLHASLLPRFRGAAPIQRAIEAGDPITGVTVQKMEKKLDAGPILIRKEVTLSGKETSASLFQSLEILSQQACLEALRVIELGQEQWVSQDESKATYASKLNKEEANLDWNQSAEELERKIRAFIPWPIAYFMVGGKPIKIHEAQIVETINTKPGTIHTDGKTFLQIQCGKNALNLTEIQPENRKKMKVHDFLSAFRGKFPHSQTE